MGRITKSIKLNYLFFLSLVIVLIVANLGITLYSINLQKQDAKIINISGKQRMLSQRISKLVSFIHYNRNFKGQIYNIDTLEKIVIQWEKAHEFLKQSKQARQNSRIGNLLNTNDNRLKSISSAVYHLIQNPSDTAINQAIDVIQKNELPFLFTMENTVIEFQKLAERKVNRLQLLQIILAITSVIILIFSFFNFVLPVIKELIQKSNHLVELNQQLGLNAKELIRREEYNKIFIEQAPGAIAMFNNKMEYMAASKNWLLDYGLEGQKIIGKSHYEIFPEIGEDWKKIHRECLNGAIHICKEAPFLRIDGSTQWLSWEVKPWYTTDNKIGGIIMFTNDITANKVNNYEKERIQEILNKTNEVAKIGTWELDLISNKIIWSPLTKEIHEVEADYEPNLEKGINFYKEGKSRDTIKQVVRDAIEKGKPFDIELEIITAKNNNVWVRSIGQAEFEGKKCSRIYGIFQDINAIKLTERKLNQSNSELKAIFNSGHVSIIGTDLNGVITYFSRGAEVLLGYQASEMIGKQTPVIIHKEEEIIQRGHELSRKFNETITGFEVFVYLSKTNQFESRQWTYIKKDGTEFQVELVVSAIKDEKGKVYGYIGVAIDITEQVNKKKSLQEANENLEVLTHKLTSQNKQLASFANITSHNLRSPVSNLNSLLYFYKSSDTEEEKEELFDKFEIVISHLTTTLNTLIDTLKIKEETNHEIEPLLFEDILNKTKEILSGQIIETNAYITSNFSEVPKIDYNKTYLESIFLNLISNSIKYRALDRPLKIHLESKKNNRQTILEVTDNGLGIDLVKHGDKLFGLNKTFHRHTDAKGIGLYLTKTQIESMGGNIYAKSKVGEGTSFIIEF